MGGPYVLTSCPVRLDSAYLSRRYAAMSGGSDSVRFNRLYLNKGPL